MVIVGITGPIGHGKTTLANFLAQQDATSQQAETSQVIAEVADRLNKFFVWEAPSELDLSSVNRWLSHLPGILESVTHTKIDHSKLVLLEQDIKAHKADYEKLWDYIYAARHNPKLLTEHIVAENKTAYRSLLQWIGGYCVTHVNTGIWYNELIRRAHVAETQGCRLFIIGGVRFPSDADIVHQAGGKIIRIVRPGAIEQDKADPTERDRVKIAYDTTITNNGNLDELMHLSMQVYGDLYGNVLKKDFPGLNINP
mgnify:CR=1 FL=1